MGFDDLSEGQKAKARACQSPEEMLALAREEGYELSDEELEAISGGDSSWGCPRDCNPICPEHGIPDQG
ncbi:MAG: Nif11-like leader peptide family natural product precursor [Atopobiaceae bacterium]|nr:Nif11-like leader peptide family natural product precursor [Atopobiaceae bacterium]